jgi:hypothetical protein
MKWPWAKDDAAAVPERILAVWTDTVMHQKNQPGVRGFGGRIYFYEPEETDPIEIDGGLAIYIFDTETIDLAAQEPLKKYVFTAEQFAEHKSQTSIGPSYSVWLPWGEVGGPPRKLSLIARFQGTEGGTVISDPTIKLLPGVTPQTSSITASGSEEQDGSHVALAGFQTRSGNSSQLTPDEQRAKQLLDELGKKRRSVETIDLPPSFQRHLENRSATGDEVAPSSDRSGAPESTDTPRESTQPASTNRANPETDRPVQPAGFTGDGSNRRTNLREGRWIESPRKRR